MSSPVRILRVLTSDINAYPDYFNSNNHFPHGKRPSDYADVIAKGQTKHWVEAFHRDAYHSITLDAKALRWLREAARVGMITNRVSPLFKENLDATCAQHADAMAAINRHLPEGANGWFVRTDDVSLKCGIHRAGPYRDLKPILESMVTGTFGHECFGPDDSTCTLYFLPWVHIDPAKEFRVFVHQNAITAISTQHWAEPNRWLSAMSDTEIANTVIHRIVAFFQTNVREPMLYMGSYVMDVALLGPDDTPYFIEPNAFGAAYGAGSALFHWLHDAKELLGHDAIDMHFVKHDEHCSPK